MRELPQGYASINVTFSNGKVTVRNANHGNAVIKRYKATTAQWEELFALLNTQKAESVNPDHGSTYILLGEAVVRAIDESEPLRKVKEVLDNEGGEVLCFPRTATTGDILSACNGYESYCFLSKKQYNYLNK